MLLDEKVRQICEQFDEGDLSLAVKCQKGENAEENKAEDSKEPKEDGTEDPA